MRLPIPLHGRTHLPGSSDPVPGGIYYEVENTGEWLRVATTGISTSSYTVGGVSANWAIGIYGDDDVVLGTNGAGASTWITSDNNVTIQAPTMDITIATQANETYDTLFTAVDDAWNVSVGTGGLEMDMSGQFYVNMAVGSQDIYLQLRNGGKLEVQDHLGNPIFRVNENGSLQGKTGQSLVFNL